CLYDGVEKVFGWLPKKNVVSWNVLVSWYVKVGRFEEAVSHFVKMMKCGVKPSSVSFVNVFPAVAGLGDDSRIAEVVYGLLVKFGDEFSTDLFAVSSAISMFAELGMIVSARKVFDSSLERNVEVWNTMIGGYVQNNMPVEAFDLFIRALHSSDNVGIDKVTLVSVLTAASQLQQLDLAKQMHAYIIKGVPNGMNDEGLVLVRDMLKQGFMIDDVTICALLSAASNLRNQEIGKQTHGYLLRHSIQFKGMESYLIDMQMIDHGVPPNAVTIASILPACSIIGSSRLAKQIHAFTIRSFLDSNVFVHSALVDTYSKLGTIALAENVFAFTHDKNAVTYTNMILGYGQHGMGEKALHLFNSMRENGIQPDSVTYSGLVDEGLRLFESMEAEYNIVPSLEHYCCVVDMLGRVGRVSEAYDFVKRLGENGDHLKIWGSLLGSCRTHGEFQLAKVVAGKLVEMGVGNKNAGYHTLLSNIYAEEGNWEFVDRLRKEMYEKGIVKETGCSWIDNGGRSDYFMLREKNNTRDDETNVTHHMLDVLDTDMKRQWKQLRLKMLQASNNSWTLYNVQNSPMSFSLATRLHQLIGTSTRNDMANAVAELIFIPTPGLGHIMSTIELARLLVNRHQHLAITVLVIKPPGAVSGSAITTYIESLAENSMDRISFIQLPQDETPPIQDLKDLRNSLTEFIKSHCKYVRNAVSDLKSQQGSGRLAGFVVDMFCTSMIDVANEFNVPTFVFFTSNAAFLGFVLFIKTLCDDLNRDTRAGLDMFQSFVTKLGEAKAIMVNTFLELETHAIESLSTGTNIPPVYPVGPILNLQGGSGAVQHVNDDIISFDEVQVKEIARGLEQSGHRFLWSLRRPPSEQTSRVPSDYEDPSVVLPKGFLERTRGIGKVIGWAPQVAVLGHDAVGGFVTHCGWNSLLESLWFGVPSATWPIYAEQQMNAFEMVVELGLAVEMRLDYEKDMFNPKANTIINVTAGEIESGIRRVMEDTEVRKKVKEMSEKTRSAMVEGGSSYASVGRLEVLFSNVGERLEDADCAFCMMDVAVEGRRIRERDRVTGKRGTDGDTRRHHGSVAAYRRLNLKKKTTYCLYHQELRWISWFLIALPLCVTMKERTLVERKWVTAQETPTLLRWMGGNIVLNKRGSGSCPHSILVPMVQCNDIS
ncbi:LOW QUALITY PROTEIN: hypothetical protein M8C21_018566, partial [Ambrosia artemisiifolia]